MHVPVSASPFGLLPKALLCVIADSCQTSHATSSRSIMPPKRTHASTQIDETQNKFHYEEAKIHPEKGFTLRESNYRDFMARIHQVAEALNWELFCEKRPSVDEELVREFYENLTSSELTEAPVHRIKQRVEEIEDPEEAEHDPTEIPPEQSAEAPNETEPLEPEAEPDVETSMFGTLPPSPDLRDELYKLMDLMQHMQWQQQAYWKYSKIRDDSMRSALKKIYNDPFIFVPEFPDFIFEPWSSLSKRDQSDSCKGNNDGAKDKSNWKDRQTNKKREDLNFILFLFFLKLI
ncbi:hypothetical protein J1N35_041096 [Gossypium stocksii]|uniref:Uncharacterized protein n=1 Tax=Gossypium stocksii TaxID=47602 RepID=A0A9D3UFH1_9ROSI|nr:hypothetical protein J1N35_041096 [Gossypium stocksii]